MPSIRLPVHDVVDQVDNAGHHTEDRRGRRSLRGGVRVEQPESEQQAREDNEVLRPLFGTQRYQYVG
jgi:hypothetical protein